MPEKKKITAHSYIWRGPGLFFGIFLVVIGLLLYARDAGWIPKASLWPFILIIAGIILVFNNGMRRLQN